MQPHKHAPYWSLPVRLVTPYHSVVALLTAFQLQVSLQVGGVDRSHEKDRGTYRQKADLEGGGGVVEGIQSVVWGWSDREVARAEIVQTAPAAVLICYAGTDSDGSHQSEVELASTPVHFGGVRWWFVCPLGCGRRCRILYLPHGAHAFGCRECHRLTYKCRQKHRDSFYECIGKPLGLWHAFATKKPRGVRAQARLLGRALAAGDALSGFAG